MKIYNQSIEKMGVNIVYIHLLMHTNIASFIKTMTYLKIRICFRCIVHLSAVLNLFLISFMFSVP